MFLSACAAVQDSKTAKDILSLINTHKILDLDNSDFTRLIQLLSTEPSTIAFVLDKMRCKPDSITYMTLLHGAAKAKDITLGKKIHAHITAQRAFIDDRVGSALLNMYSKCGEPNTAVKIFEDLKKQNQLTTKHWNILISAFAHVKPGQALQLFKGTTKKCNYLTSRYETRWLHSRYYNICQCATSMF